MNHRHRSFARTVIVVVRLTPTTRRVGTEREPVVEIVIVIAIEVEMKSSSTRARVCADDDDRSIVDESTSCDRVYGSIDIWACIHIQ